MSRSMSNDQKTLDWTHPFAWISSGTRLEMFEIEAIGMKNAFWPTIGITMGDPSGIGPEIIMKSLAQADLYTRCRPLVIGDAGRLREAERIVLSRLEVNAIDNLHAAKFTPGTVDCIDLKLIPADL